MDCLSVGLLVADHLSTPISHLPRPGELVLADALPLAIGGCAANAAIDLRRVGVDVGVIGCVGEDSFGRFVIETLAGHGISTSGVQSVPGVGTSGTLIINVKGEDRRFIHTVGANASLACRHFNWDLIRTTKVLYLGGYLLLPGLDPQELANLLRQARQFGVQTVVDVVLPGPGDYWPQLRPILPHTDVFLPNSDEAAIITGQQDPWRQAEAFRQAGAHTVVITCGGEGSVLVAPGLRLQAGTFPTTYLGGTGAGDAFDAGYIVGLLSGQGPEHCLAWGSALGASCVRGIGATETVFTRAEAEAFLQANRLPIQRL